MQNTGSSNCRNCTSNSVKTSLIIIRIHDVCDWCQFNFIKCTWCTIPYNYTCICHSQRVHACHMYIYICIVVTSTLHSHLTSYIYIPYACIFVLNHPLLHEHMPYIQSASNVMYLYCDSDSVCACISVCHGNGS